MIQTTNTMVQQFPTVFIARIFGFGAREFFNVNEEREALVQKPTVKF